MRRPDRRPRLQHGGSAIPGRWCGRGGLDHLGQWLAALTSVLCFSAVAIAQEAPGAAEALASAPQRPDTGVHYVGLLDGSEFTVAVVDHGGRRVAVYLCDGAEPGLSLVGSGDAATGIFGAQATNGATATGTIAGDAARGEVALADGTVLTFTAPRAVLPAGRDSRVAREDGAAAQACAIDPSDGPPRQKE